MWLEAIFPVQDIRDVLQRLLPTTFHLGSGEDEGGELHLDAPTSVALVADCGLEVVCGAKLRWAVLGFHVPVTIDSATLLLEPTVRHTAGERDTLVFAVKLLALEAPLLPSLLEGAAVERINAAMAEHEHGLAWDFADTLSHRFALPLSPARTLDLETKWGELRITTEALVFVVSVHAGTDTPEKSPRTLLPVLARPVESPLARRRPWTRVVKSLAILGGASLVAATFAFAVKRRRSRWLVT